jgi:hypothetical protein
VKDCVDPGGRAPSFRNTVERATVVRSTELRADPASMVLLLSLRQKELKCKFLRKRYRAHVLS